MQSRKFQVTCHLPLLIGVGLDRHSLQPRIVENNTHLAHSLVRYLGVSSPGELTAFCISSAADLSDLISRVSNPWFGYHNLHVLVVCHKYFRVNFALIDTGGGIGITACRTFQPFLCSRRGRRFSSVSSQPRGGAADASHCSERYFTR